jgi:asparagine synthase (glutamine-hydrolysing)
MCGISIIVDKADRARLHGDIETMNRAVAHRGPDGDGISIVEAVGLGHTRLAIIDLSNRAAQPMARGRHHLTYNGEIYNFAEIRGDLEAAGRQFTTQSDTEVLLVALMHWGMAALDRLKGMFAFAYLNQEEGALYLVRDRFGKKPLAYSHAGGRLVAASEIKQILAVQPSAGINMTSAMRFLEDSQTNESEYTFFNGIENVKAGHYLRLELRTGQIDIIQWYHLAAHIVPYQGGSYDDCRDKVRALLTAAATYR